MELFYVNRFSSGEVTSNTKSNTSPASTKAKESKRKWYSILLEQCINAGIIGGIAFFAAIDWETGLKAAGIAFLIELRKYRKL